MKVVVRCGERVRWRGLLENSICMGLTLHALVVPAKVRDVLQVQNPAPSGLFLLGTLVALVHYKVTGAGITV